MVLDVFLEIPQGDLVQRIDGSLQMPSRNVQVDCRVFETLMTQQYLDGAQVSPGLQHVRGETVPKRMRSNPLG